MKEKDYDVIIYGAGADGVAAALLAAEHSARTLLIDDGSCPGGDVSLGLLNHWTGDSACPAMEGIKAFSKRAWGKSILEPEDLSASFAMQLAAARVDTLYRAMPVKLKLKKDRITSMSLATAQGKVKLSAWCWVDASPDYSLARLCGCPMDHVREPSMTLLARIGGIDTRVPGVFDAEALRQYAEKFRCEQAYEELPQEMSFPRLMPCPRGGTAILDASASGIRPIESAREHSAAECVCRANIVAAIDFLKRNVPGFENCFLIHFAQRSLLMDRPRPLRARTFAAITASANIEDTVILTLKDPARPDSPLPVPFGNLMCQDIDNLLLARATGIAMENLCAQLLCGGAAGRIAALSVLYDGSITKIEPERFRRAMQEENSETQTEA